MISVMMTLSIVFFSLSPTSFQSLFFRPFFSHFICLSLSLSCFLLHADLCILANTSSLSNESLLEQSLITFTTCSPLIREMFRCDRSKWRIIVTAINWNVVHAIFYNIFRASNEPMRRHLECCLKISIFFIPRFYSILL